MPFLELDASDKLFVSSKQVDEFVKDEAEVFMILYSMKDSSKDVIGELPVVCHFPEVFPDDISDLPPDHEIEFAIDLEPDTSLVSMSPYRMSTSELSELKKKLEYLLEKKLVRLSVLLWGAPMLLVKKSDDSMRLCVNY